MTKQNLFGKKSRTKYKSKVKSGKITRNPFLNFMRDFRRSKAGMRVSEIAKMGGMLWRNMSDIEKDPYLSMARNAPIRRSKGRKFTVKKRIKKELNETAQQTLKTFTDDLESKKEAPKSFSRPMIINRSYEVRDSALQVQEQKRPKIIELPGPGPSSRRE